MPLLINNNKKYIIIAPPKNGCTTIKNMFKKFNNINCEEFDEYIIGNNINNNYSNYIIYFIYRNIFERFISYITNILNNRLSNNNTEYNQDIDIKFISLKKMYLEYTGEILSLNTKISNIINFLHNIDVDNNNFDVDIHYLSNIYWLNAYLKKLNLIFNNNINIKIINIYEIDTILFPFMQNIHNNYNVDITYYNISLCIKNINCKEILFHDLDIENILSQKKYLMNNFLFLKEIVNLYNKDYNFIIEVYKNNDIINNDIINIYNSYTINKKFQFSNIPKDFIFNIYKELNNDLLLLDEDNLKKHYILYWKIENRKYKYENIPDDFDPSIYIELHNDLKDMNLIESKIHYENFGFIENRKYKY